MMKLMVNSQEIECTKAVKGADCINLYDGENVIAEFKGITDFAGYELSGGEWSKPEPTTEERMTELAETIDIILTEVISTLMV